MIGIVPARPKVKRCLIFSSTYVVAGPRIRTRRVVSCCISATLQSNKYAPPEMGDGGGIRNRWDNNKMATVLVQCVVCECPSFQDPIPNFALLHFTAATTSTRGIVHRLIDIDHARTTTPTYNNNISNTDDDGTIRQPIASQESSSSCPWAGRPCRAAPDRAPPPHTHLSHTHLPQHREASSVARNARVVVHPRFPRQPEPRTPPPPTPNPANAPPGPPPICGPSPGPETGLLNPGGLPWKDVR